MKICSVVNCTNNHYAKNLCEKHYVRMKKGQSLTEKSVYQLTTLEKFEIKFTKTDTCWIWHSLRKDGRCNTFMLNGKVRSAHTAAYILYKGDIPDGEIVCHTCDDGRCVNPDHLWLGTYKENTQDMFKKGRNNTPCGERKIKGSKLTEKIVIEIRNSSLKASELAKRHGVASRTVRDVINNITWKHV